MSTPTKTNYQLDPPPPLSSQKTGPSKDEGCSPKIESESRHRVPRSRDSSGGLEIESEAKSVAVLINFAPRTAQPSHVGLVRSGFDRLKRSGPRKGYAGLTNKSTCRGEMQTGRGATRVPSRGISLTCRANTRQAERTAIDYVDHFNGARNTA